MGGDLSRNIAVSSDMREYFSSLQEDIDLCYSIANKARKKGRDPEFEVEIPQALDLAARVEQLVGPKGIAPNIREVTEKIGERELVSLEIAKEIVKGNGIAVATPIVDVRDPKAHVTHEAAVGSVDKKQLETLMSRGLDEDEASELIIQGLLS